MRLLIFSDVHWSTYSSIVRCRGEKYSTRLENLIDSLNWVERFAEENFCDRIICLGDFFDKSELDAESITALNDIEWANIPHTFLVGNHEVSSADLKYSTAHLFNLKNCEIINTTCMKSFDNFEIMYLPYFLEKDRPVLKDVFSKRDMSKWGLLLSHNDIKGINYGRYVSQEGFTVEELESVCDVCINGHLHNTTQVTNKICNIGNLTGQNFSEDAFISPHNIMLINTDEWSFHTVENPYALNFYKIEMPENWSIDYLNNLCFRLKRNSVLTIKCKEDNGYQCLRARFDPHWPDNGFPKCANVITSKFIIERETSDKEVKPDVSFTVDHLAQFKDYILQNVGSDEITISELQEICK